MHAALSSAPHWLLGPEAKAPVSRLWERYRALQLENARGDAGSASSFRAFRLRSLGIAEPAPAMLDATAPTLLTNASQLKAIEERFRHADGRTLQAIVTYDIASRVLVEVETRCPFAPALVDEARALLTKYVPHVAGLLDTMEMWIVPIYHERLDRPFRRGFSHMDYLGALFTSFVEREAQAEPVRAAILAVDLAHELGHQVLMLYQHADGILETPADTPVYSPVRKVDRPAILALHAAVAAAFMMETCEALSQASSLPEAARGYARASLAELAMHQRQGLTSLRERCRFGAFGRRLFAELETQSLAYAAVSCQRHDSLSYFGLSK